jgi:electron transfer flavoprotein alpha/beta subunit
MTAPRIAVWLGSAEPVRSIRWLDGVLKAASKLGGGTAVAAGERSWLDLAADRAARFGLAAVGVATDLQLDYLGWAQVMAAVAHKLAATTVLVDEASRADRFAEVAAIAELLDAAQLTHVVALARADDAGGLQASRTAGSALQTVRIHGPAVIGVRIAGPAIDEYPTPMPSVAMRQLSLAALGLDPSVLSHRALPPRTNQPARRTVARVAEHLAVHAAPRPPAPAPPPPPRDSRPRIDGKPRRAKTETKSHKPASKSAKGARGDKSE